MMHGRKNINLRNVVLCNLLRYNEDCNLFNQSSNDMYCLSIKKPCCFSLGVSCSVRVKLGAHNSEAFLHQPGFTTNPWVPVSETSEMR